MSAREWCEEGGLYVNGDNWWHRQGLHLHDLKISRFRDSRQEFNTHYWVKDGWRAPWRNQWMAGMHGEAPWHLAESFTQAQRDGRILHARKLTHATASHYGSSLVDLSCDSGWDGASRCRTTVGLDEHRTVVRRTLRKTLFWSSCSQTLWSART